MWSHHAERLVAGEPSVVRDVIAALVEALWSGRSRLLMDQQHHRIDAVAAESATEEADVWLTWQLNPHPEGTRLELRLDELARGPDPHSELTALLDTVAAGTQHRASDARPATRDLPPTP